MTQLLVQNLCVDLSGRRVVTDANLRVDPGEFVGLIGPNGAGKSSLLRAALGLIPHSGGVSNIAALPPAKRALEAAWMPQGRDIAWGMTVGALVSLGRIPHARPQVDDAAVTAALDALGITHLRDRDATRLSGGEQARVLIARALAQDTPLVLADEPIAGLDPGHQIGAMAVFRSLADRGKGVVVSTHDLGLAARHCTRLILMDHGRIVADGAPLDVLTADLLAQVFGITAYLGAGPDGPIFQPLDLTAPHC